MQARVEEIRHTTKLSGGQISRTAKEALFISRLLGSMKLKLEEGLAIQCDNRQTIRLVTEDSMKLNTKLRHVDIHNHWLRQEHHAGRIRIEWIPTSEMLADGLTKALTHQRHEVFIKLISSLRGYTPQRLRGCVALG